MIFEKILIRKKKENAEGKGFSQHYVYNVDFLKILASTEHCLIPVPTRTKIS